MEAADAPFPTPLPAGRGSDADRPARGFLTVIAGCMFSGKTTELLRRLEGVPPGCALAIKHFADSRYSPSQIVSHAGKARPAVIVRHAREVLDHVRPDTLLVGIDEGHFFDDKPSPFQGEGRGEGESNLLRHRSGTMASYGSKGLRGVTSLCRVARLLTDRRIDVVIAALQPDSWHRSFPLVSRLMELADHATLRQATCARCGAPADHTQRLTPIIDSQMVVDPDNYEPRCPHCWRPPPERAPALYALDA